MRRRHRVLLERLKTWVGPNGELDVDGLALSVEEPDQRTLLNRLLDEESLDPEALRDQLVGALDFFDRRRKDREIAAIKSRGLDDRSLEEIVQHLKRRSGPRGGAERP